MQHIRRNLINNFPGASYHSVTDQDTAYSAGGFSATTCFGKWSAAAPANEAVARTLDAAYVLHLKTMRQRVSFFSSRFVPVVCSIHTDCEESVTASCNKLFDSVERDAASRDSLNLVPRMGIEK